MHVLRAHFSAYLSTTCYRDFSGFDPESASTPFQLGVQGIPGSSTSRVLGCSSDATSVVSSMRMISDGMVFRSLAADFTKMWSDACYWFYMFQASEQFRAQLQDQFENLEQSGGLLNPVVIEEEEEEEDPEMVQPEPEAAEEVEDPDSPPPPLSPHQQMHAALVTPPAIEPPEPQLGAQELAPLPAELVDGPPIQLAPHILPPPEPAPLQPTETRQARMSVRREVFMEAASTRAFLHQVLGLQGGSSSGGSSDAAGTSSDPSDF